MSVCQAPSGPSTIRRTPGQRKRCRILIDLDPFLTAYFDKGIKSNDCCSAEMLQEIQRGKKRMLTRELSPNCSLNQVNREK